MSFAFRAAVVSSLFAAMFAATAAQAFDDNQSWNAWTVNLKVTDTVTVAHESHFRFYDDASRLGQLLMRPQVTYNASANHSYTVGYAYILTRPSTGVVLNEHRAWQQLGYTGLALGKWMLSGRTRLEQRYVEGRGGDIGWRLRQQVRAVVPVGGTVQALLWNETFVGFNKTAWGQRANLDQSRSFLGVAWRISDKHTLEPGAMHQRIFRNGPDTDNIVLSVTLVSRF